jgi:hypothetical protein
LEISRGIDLASEIVDQATMQNWINRSRKSTPCQPFPITNEQNIMKLRKNKFSEKPLNTSLPQQEKTTGTTLFAYAGTAITILSILAWTAGHSYRTGYWDKADLPNSYFTSTIQETMFDSINAVESWTSFVLILVISGLTLIFGSIRPNKPKPLVKKAKASRWKLDENMSFFGLSLAGIAYALLFGILGFAIWFWSAAQTGEQAYSKVVCSLRSAKDMPNVMLMADGTTLRGRIIGRADNVTLLVNREGLHVISIKQKPALIEIVPLPEVSCKSPPETEK